MTIANESSDKTIDAHKITKGIFSAALRAVANDPSILKEEMLTKERVKPRNIPEVEQSNINKSTAVGRLKSSKPSFHRSL